MSVVEVAAEVRGEVGFITLNRPKALNALSLDMIRALTEALVAWRDDPKVKAVAVRGMGKEHPFGVFCVGGDIRFFHVAAHAGDKAALDAFFTEEYRLNHLIHTYPKPYVTFLDGIVMGGGMGISGHGGKNSLRIVTERTRMAMPETNIGLFPDVGGGWFLAHCCPGRIGDYLALTGESIGGADALFAGLADVQVDSTQLPALWEGLASDGVAALQSLPSRDAMKSIAADAVPARLAGQIDSKFAAGGVPQVLQALESGDSDWSRHTAAVLRKRSPLMLFVVQEQLRRARAMTLAEDLRMERDMVHHCFWLRPGAASETVEGIRALVIDKDQQPKWNPARIEDVTPAMVDAFFASPWAPQDHPLRELA